MEVQIPVLAVTTSEKEKDASFQCQRKCIGETQNKANSAERSRSIMQEDLGPALLYVKKRVHREIG